MEDQLSEILVIRNQDSLLMLCEGKQLIVGFPLKIIHGVEHVVPMRPQPTNDVAVGILVGESFPAARSNPATTRSMA